MTKAWNRFWCASCQTERLISERVKQRHRVVCKGCVNRTSGGTPKPGRKEIGWAEDSEVRIDTCPEGLVDSYRESRDEY